MNWYKIAEGNTVTVTPQEFKAMSSDEKLALAKNTNITPEVQRMFLKPEYWYQWQYRFLALQYLAFNTSISSQTQKLFFTEEYDNKQLVLKILFDYNPSFLKGLTLKEMREFTKTNKLPVYKKRFKTVREKIKL